MMNEMMKDQEITELKAKICDLEDEIDYLHDYRCAAEIMSHGEVQ